MERDPRILFHETPTINPETGRSIQIGKATYNNLVRKYGAPPGVVVPPQTVKNYFVLRRKNTRLIRIPHAVYASRLEQVTKYTQGTGSVDS